MTNEEILKKAITKAVKNGYKPEYTASELIDEVTLTADSEALALAMIFSHDFAKAFWGKERWWFVEGLYKKSSDLTKKKILKLARKSGVLEDWQHHLQQMVISEDPIKYLEQFIDPKSGGESD